jgi:hypothetical protein
VEINLGWRRAVAQSVLSYFEKFSANELREEGLLPIGRRRNLRSFATEQ